MGDYYGPYAAERGSGTKYWTWTDATLRDLGSRAFFRSTSEGDTKDEACRFSVTETP